MKRTSQWACSVTKEQNPKAKIPTLLKTCGPRSQIKVNTFPLVDRGSTVVKVLCYKSEGRWFDSR